MKRSMGAARSSADGDCHRIEADYLVVGAGAMGLAFVDELIHRDPSATVVLVDRRAMPGGHWNDAYAFVSLHQPAAYYGVNSMALGEGGAALATGREVLAYFGRALDRLLATGRVRFFGQCEYEGEARFRSCLVPDRRYQVDIRRKLVDASYMQSEVPAMRPPPYAVDPSVAVVPINGLAELSRREGEPPSSFVIVGAGKTGMDAALYLLDQGVAPEAITWIVSNDAWFLRRERIQPGTILDFMLEQFERFGDSESLDGLVFALECAGIFSRLDPAVAPTKYRCATVSDPELAQLRRLTKVVRLGRVVRVEADAVVLERGRLPVVPGQLFVDCTAKGLPPREPRPVFEGSTITLQSLLMCQQVLSAAFIAYLETRTRGPEPLSLARCNALCQVVPHPEEVRDYAQTMLTTLLNIQAWAEACREWLFESRLSFFHHERRVDVLRATLKIESARVAAEKGLRAILAATDPDPEPEFETVELRHGPLRASTLTLAPRPSRERAAVLCLHGFPDNARSFRHQLPALAAAGYRVYAPTLRGYEPSSQPEDGDYSLAALAGDVLAWLDELGLERAHLIGHDWGAAVAYTVGALAPERFWSLTTLAVPHPAQFVRGVARLPRQVLNSWYMLFFQVPGAPELALRRRDWALIRQLWAAWSPGYTLPPEEWAALRETFEAPGVDRAMLAYYRRNLVPTFVDGLRGGGSDEAVIRVPTLALTGADDGCIDTRLYEGVDAREFPEGFRLERVEGAGHFLHQERPEAVNALVLDWLAQHDPAG